MTDSLSQCSTVSWATTASDLEKLSEKAFTKALVSAIIAQFPVACFVSIFMSKKASKLIQNIENIAEQNNLDAGGLKTAAKAIAKVGLGVGIGYSAFWIFYFLLFFFSISLTLIQSYTGI